MAKRPRLSAHSDPADFAPRTRRRRRPAYAQRYGGQARVGGRFAPVRLVRRSFSEGGRARAWRAGFAIAARPSKNTDGRSIRCVEHLEYVARPIDEQLVAAER
jgi:hypothetical protein